MTGPTYLLDVEPWWTVTDDEPEENDADRRDFYRRADYEYEMDGDR